MKVIVLSILFFILTSFTIQAQSHVDFGIKGGLNFTFFKVIEADFGPNTETETGFYTGLFADFHIDDHLSIQPEVLYIGLNDFKFINAPIYAKYLVGEDFSVLIGPSLNYFPDFFINKFKIRADLSVAYNITSAIDTHMKYTLGFEEIAPNGLFVGFGLKL